MPKSAIPDMSVAEVRRHLDFMRGMYADRRTCPFFLTDELQNGMTYQEFSFQFVKGQHQKRHARSRRPDGAAAGEEQVQAQGEEKKIK